MTVIMISHDVERAIKEATKILDISNNGFSFVSSQNYYNSVNTNSKKGEK